MFVLEIDFHDGVSPPEVLLVRRPHAIIGVSDFAHVVIEGAASSFYELRVTRGVGREFRCQPISRVETNQPLPIFLDGVYSGEAEIDLGEVTTRLTSVDLDLQLQAGESPDRAGLRVLRQALTTVSPIFPAIAVLSAVPVFASFPPTQSLLVGRSRKCGLRLDSSEVSSEHARFGFSDGKFWVEDLGSTNGTFVHGQRISGRRFLETGETVMLGTEFALAGIADPTEIAALNQRSASLPVTMPTKQRFPCLLAQSDLVRPSRFVLHEGARVGMGRDPANDIWVGAAHISRNHVEVMLNRAQKVEVLDVSSNGTYLNKERLPRAVPTEIPASLATIDLGAGVIIGICFSAEDEEEFLSIKPQEIDAEASGLAVPSEKGQEASSLNTYRGPGMRSSFGKSQQGAPRKPTLDEPTLGNERKSVFDTSSMQVGSMRAQELGNEDVEKAEGAEGDGERDVEAENRILEGELSEESLVETSKRKRKQRKLKEKGIFGFESQMMKQQDRRRSWSNTAVSFAILGLVAIVAWLFLVFFVLP